MTLRVAIIGGGIGGLSAALALLRQGFDVQVYEQAARFGEMLRHLSGGDPTKVYEAERAARAEKPELWAGVYVNTEKEQA